MTSRNRKMQVDFNTLKHEVALFTKSTKTVVYSIDFAAIMWHNVPESVLKIAKCTKFLYAIDLLFEIPTFIKTSQRAIWGKNRLISCLRCALTTSRIAGYSIRIISACRDAGIVEKHAFAWTRKTVKVLFGMRIIGLFLFVFDLSKLDKPHHFVQSIPLLLKISDVAITGLMIFTPATPALYAAATIESLCSLIFIY